MAMMGFFWFVSWYTAATELLLYPVIPEERCLAKCGCRPLEHRHVESQRVTSTPEKPQRRLLQILTQNSHKGYSILVLHWYPFISPFAAFSSRLMFFHLFILLWACPMPHLAPVWVARFDRGFCASWVRFFILYGYILCYSLWRAYFLNSDKNAVSDWDTIAGSDLATAARELLLFKLVLMRNL